MLVTFSKRSLLAIRISFLALFTLTLVLSGFTPSYAQDAVDSSGLSISPVIFELQADPGDMVSNQIRITNPTSFTQTVSVQVEDFVPIGEEGEVTLSDPSENNTFSIAKWTTIEPSEVVILPGKSQYITFTIKPPRNAEPGGHYGSIVALVSGAANNTTGSAIATKRGALVLMRISGDIEEDIAVESFTTKSFQEYGPVDFSLKFRNNGNVHVRPAGFITITDLFGKQVAELPIPANNVIPDAVRKADTTWNEKNLIGRYTATVVATYGSTTKKTVTSVITFTVFPLKKALIILAIVVALGTMVFLSRKRLALAFKVLLGKK